jgi:hypothetical protein
MTLAEALAGVELEVGRTYVVQQRNQLIQVRVVPLQEPLPTIVEHTSDEMLHAPCDLPGLVPAAIVRPSSQTIAFGRPFEMTEVDLAPGDSERFTPNRSSPSESTKAT